MRMQDKDFFPQSAQVLELYPKTGPSSHVLFIHLKTQWLYGIPHISLWLTLCEWQKKVLLFKREKGLFRDIFAFLEGKEKELQ